jgi:hypothetical protein
MEETETDMQTERHGDVISTLLFLQEGKYAEK